MPVRDAVFVVAFGIVPVVAVAHHAGGVAQFDRSRPVTLTGTVTHVEWQHPHTGFNLEVLDARGIATTWEFVLAGPSNLLRRGWKKTTLKAGDVITVKGFAARDGSPVASAESITRPDGRSVVPGAASEPAAANAKAGPRR